MLCYIAKFLFVLLVCPHFCPFTCMSAFHNFLPFVCLVNFMSDFQIFRLYVCLCVKKAVLALPRVGTRIPKKLSLNREMKQCLGIPYERVYPSATQTLSHYFLRVYHLPVTQSAHSHCFQSVTSQSITCFTFVYIVAYNLTKACT